MSETLLIKSSRPSHPCRSQCSFTTASILMSLPLRTLTCQKGKGEYQLTSQNLFHQADKFLPTKTNVTNTHVDSRRAASQLSDIKSPMSKLIMKSKWGTLTVLLNPQLYTFKNAFSWTQGVGGCFSPDVWGSTCAELSFYKRFSIKEKFWNCL